MKLIMLIVGISVIAIISLVAGFMWSLFLPGTGMIVGVGTFIVLVLMTAIKS